MADGQRTFQDRSPKVDPRADQSHAAVKDRYPKGGPSGRPTRTRRNANMRQTKKGTTTPLSQVIRPARIQWAKTVRKWRHWKLYFFLFITLPLFIVSLIVKIVETLVRIKLRESIEIRKPRRQWIDDLVTAPLRSAPTAPLSPASSPPRRGSGDPPSPSPAPPAPSSHA